MKNEYERLICIMDIDGEIKKDFGAEGGKNKPQIEQDEKPPSKKELLKQLIYCLAEDDPSLDAIGEFAKVIEQNRIKGRPPSR